MSLKIAFLVIFQDTLDSATALLTEIEANDKLTIPATAVVGHRTSSLKSNYTSMQSIPDDPNTRLSVTPPRTQVTVSVTTTAASTSSSDKASTSSDSGNSTCTKRVQPQQQQQQSTPPPPPTTTSEGSSSSSSDTVSVSVSVSES